MLSSIFGNMHCPGNKSCTVQHILSKTQKYTVVGESIFTVVHTEKTRSYDYYSSNGTVRLGTILQVLKKPAFINNTRINTEFRANLLLPTPVFGCSVYILIYEWIQQFFPEAMVLAWIVMISEISIARSKISFPNPKWN